MYNRREIDRVNKRNAKHERLRGGLWEGDDRRTERE